MLDSAQQPAPPTAPDPAAALLAALERLVEGAGAEGLSPQQAAAFVGVSPAKWHAMVAAGQTPAPAEMGDRCPRFSRTELRCWLLAGAPARSRWQLLRDAALRRVG